MNCDVCECEAVAVFNRLSVFISTPKISVRFNRMGVNNTKKTNKQNNHPALLKTYINTSWGIRECLDHDVYVISTLHTMLKI